MFIAIEATGIFIHVAICVCTVDIREMYLARLWVFPLGTGSACLVLWSQSCSTAGPVVCMALLLANLGGRLASDATSIEYSFADGD